MNKRSLLLAAGLMLVFGQTGMRGAYYEFIGGSSPKEKEERRMNTIKNSLSSVNGILEKWGWTKKEDVYPSGLVAQLRDGKNYLRSLKKAKYEDYKALRQKFLDKKNELKPYAIKNGMAEINRLFSLVEEAKKKGYNNMSEVTRQIRLIEALERELEPTKFLADKKDKPGLEERMSILEEYKKDPTLKGFIGHQTSPYLTIPSH